MFLKESGHLNENSIWVKQTVDFHAVFLIERKDHREPVNMSGSTRQPSL